jgi:proteic killer suppression protein
MIRSFADAETERVFNGIASRKLPSDIQKTARRKLVYLDDAEDLRDLLAPPGNRLEKLSGDRAGVSTVFELTTNGEFVSSGPMATQLM